MLLNRQSSGERWRARPDGPGKVTGALAYLTDRTAPDMLIGRVLRSPHPHAAILAIHAEKARALPGVHAVLTYRDVPGLNGYGIAVQDQPVLCVDRVRYVGDAVAAVAADTDAIADQALSLIEVEYRLLPIVESPAAALADGAPLLHGDGNILHRTDYKRGDVDVAFASCTHIVEEVYDSPRQMHTYMETEGGLFVPEKDGRLTVHSPTQHGFMDRLQLSRITGMPEERIRILSSPIGGSFGGKDELNVQPYGALLALKTNRPVKIHNSRKESVRAGLKRHPMVIAMKTGIDANGAILAHQVKITADTGPYATLGAEVLNFATEHALGPYRYGSVEVDSVSVYTNNGMSGEFRGFGGNQAIFALEGQMDRLADACGMDPWDFRLRNMRESDAPGPFGQPIAPTNGAKQAWDALEASSLWQERRQNESAATVLRSESSGGMKAPWLKTGIGAAFIMHGSGLGVGIPDPGGGRIKLAPDGKIEVQFGYEECGQGLLASLELMLIEQFGFAPEDLRLVIGDTDVVPNSGSTTASRATTMMWKSLQRLRPGFQKELLAAAAALLGLPEELLRLGRGGIWNSRAIGENRGNRGREADVEYADLAAAAGDMAGIDISGIADTGSGNAACKHGADVDVTEDTEERLLLTYRALAGKTPRPIVAETSFAFPASPFPRTGAHYLYTFAAVAVKAEVNTLTGRVRVLEQYHAVAAGPVVNPQGYLGQIEGGSIMALGYALTEEALMQQGQYATSNLDTYLIPTIADAAGEMAIEPIEELPEGDNYGPRGIGEIGSVGLAPAILAAVHDATGKRLNRLPIDPLQLAERPAFT
ncbi:molybdopterin cofactor-binding domain-containing protein [Paenibacillus sacheonensis]|uniref:Molybdopterin-dependent oxidoreductase n=1 Tax=Paenibacillus sacheonensis TaxID=742054 RepID=A0A7X4YKL8_9BACL|nr:molybdopterin cofactor-binding domain-containing protein [Paenibacillus sacheonensis]MBM7563304.1 CO/xanthine dehydrogenase Mo-binding subunit [Paenibacillus sacheonensis]NBC68138.1 molybdopterin-dependent oxidoreductase [Paenibacillus sacheonensis]